MHDEEISEISKTYLHNNGRAKAGACQKGTASKALNLSKENKGNETSTENSMLENNDEVIEIQDEKDNEESLADTEND